MGYKLRREVRDALPPGVLTAAERLLVLELADVCADDTREGWPGAAKLAELTDLSERSIQEAMARIGRKWIELRVPIEIKNGKPIFAYIGRRTTYRFPKTLTIGGATDPGASGATDPGASEERGAMDRGERCDRSVPEVRQIRGPSPSRTSFKSNHSSLSPREDEASAPNVPAQEPERETEEASPKTRTDNPVHRLLLDAGCPTERLTDAEAWITAEYEPRSIGWWRTTAGNGDLKVHVAAFLAAGLTAEVCPDCDGAGSVGDWMNARPCDCLWWEDPGAARKAFVAHLDGFPPCSHGVNGGDQQAPNGWRYCGQCRGPGWVDPNVQPRTEDKANRSRRSTGVLRAEQALRVAASLEAQTTGPPYANRKAIGNGPGRYTPWREPADQSEYDAPLY